MNIEESQLNYYKQRISAMEKEIERLNLELKKVKILTDSIEPTNPNIFFNPHA